MKVIYQSMAIAIMCISVACNSPKTSKETTHQAKTNNKLEVERPDSSSIDMAQFFQCALEGNLDQLSAAIDNGVDVNAYDENKHTALMLAAYNGHHHIIKLLIEKGANISLVDGVNRTALMFASTGPFTQAVEVLIKAGADVNSIDNEEKWTPVMMAAAEGQLDVVKVLVSNGADLKMVDIDGESSLDFAQSNGHTEVANYIKSQLK